MVGVFHVNDSRKCRIYYDYVTEELHVVAIRAPAQ